MFHFISILHTVICKRSFVARHFLSVIYALLSVILAMSDIRECERKTNMGYGHRLIKSLRENMTEEEVAESVK